MFLVPTATPTAPTQPISRCTIAPGVPAENLSTAAVYTQNGLFDVSPGERRATNMVPPGPLAVGTWTVGPGILTMGTLDPGEPAAKMSEKMSEKCSRRVRRDADADF